MPGKIKSACVGALTAATLASTVLATAAPAHADATKCAAFKGRGKASAAACINTELQNAGHPALWRVIARAYVKLDSSASNARSFHYQVQYHRKPMGEGWQPWKTVADGRTTVPAGRTVGPIHVHTDSAPALGCRDTGQFWAVQARVSYGGSGGWSDWSHIYTGDCDT
ncbi:MULTISPECIES: hypothetical protein [Streptomyces]|uniref:Secreted protein n=1 Tax=Streptomyces caniscabiei TaxID=2746961 RepID=A0ABU4N1T0_9ACTN|nr:MULTISPECIES: hypothetical protein [Streptomyces]MBE4733316.1 hypothetical protein [Streptomyces caniscabiei]MBE4754494.1 hypothetical protein [Streptomyces caniscabiei]MBE4768685.1 hypothetical protein [Streptomyces caniscabiei]MBE4781811.1 hypothetical protein [Streptomyces caniscabiei]MBE4793101.1 hypothetical protein [Streptomyces caniscabiei]